MTAQTAQYRNKLPQMGSRMFVADGGLETSMIFLQDIDLPLFAAFPLIASDEGTAQLESYFKPYIDIAIANKAGIILDTPTWRWLGRVLIAALEKTPPKDEAPA